MGRVITDLSQFIATPSFTAFLRLELFRFYFYLVCQNYGIGHHWNPKIAMWDFYHGNIKGELLFLVYQIVSYPSI